MFKSLRYFNDKNYMIAEMLYDEFGERREEILPGACPEFPNGFGLRVETEHPVPSHGIVTALNDPRVLLDATDHFGFIEFANTVHGISMFEHLHWIKNDPGRFIPFHVDEDVLLTFLRSGTILGRKRSYGTTFSTKNAVNSAIQNYNATHSTPFKTWEDLNYIYRTTHWQKADANIDVSTDRELKEMREQIRRIIKKIDGPLYEHSWRENPDSTLVFSNQGPLVHARLIPEAEIKNKNHNDPTCHMFRGIPRRN